MRILHVFFSFKVGGAETMLIDIMNIQVKEYEVFLMIINENIDERLIEMLDPRIKVFRLNRKNRSKNPLPIFKLNWLINTLPIDIIHCHVLTISKYILYSRKPLFATKHTMGYYGTYCLKYKKIFAISESVYKELQSYNYPNIVLAPNGIKFNLIKERKLSEIHDKQEYFKIITVGRLEHERKGQHLLIEAADELINKRGNKNLTIDIIGDGNSFDFLNEYVRKVGLEDYIIFLGNKSRDYIYDNLQKYDIFILPSIEEGFGISVIEACAACLPVIVPNIDGPMEIIEGGKIGYYFERNNSLDLANKLLSVMKNYSKTREKVILANNKIKNTYMIEKTAHIYNLSYRDNQ